MAPRSRGAGAVFSCFSGEDSGQTGEATSEPRVARCSQSFHLFNATGLMDQLAASRKDSAHEGGCPEEKRVKFSARFSYFLSMFARMFDLAPDVSFRRSWYCWKACATLFLKVLDLREIELGMERYGSANRGHRSVFGPSEGIFPIEIPAKLGKILTIQEFHIVSEHVLFLMHPGLRINSLRFPISDFDDLGVAGKLMLPTFLKYGPCTEANLGQSAQSSFWSGQRSSQTWSNLLKLWEVCFGPRLEVLLMWWGPYRVKLTRSNLGQSWSNLPELREMCSGPCLEVLLMWWVPVGFGQLAPDCPVLHADTRENPRGIPAHSRCETDASMRLDHWLVPQTLKSHGRSNPGLGALAVFNSPPHVLLPRIWSARVEAGAGVGVGIGVGLGAFLAVCLANAIRADISTIFFVFTASSILSPTGIRSTKNCNCRPIIRSNHTRLGRCLPTPSNERSSSAVSTIRPHVPLECPGKFGSTAAYYPHIAPSFRNTSESLSSGFGDVGGLGGGPVLVRGCPSGTPHWCFCRLLSSGLPSLSLVSPLGADDHANIDLPEEVKGYWIKGESLSTRPLIPMGVEEEKGVFMTLGPRYKRVRGGSVPVRQPPESRFDP
uniref:Uncharacterized protein n=1 Tax=Fagus sylvatica TaxID=28930 RepID=A0A2N9GVB8_FAGSY